MSTLQAEVLRGTELADASIGQIRLRLFKIAACLKASLKRIHIELCSADPLQGLFNFFDPDQQIFQAARAVGAAKTMMKFA